MKTKTLIFVLLLATTFCNSQEVVSFMQESLIVGSNSTVTNVNPIQLNPNNPNYFLYNQNPAIILTSGEHYGAVLNLDFDYETYLNTLKADGLNGTRLCIGSMVEYRGWYNIAQNTWAPAPNRYSCPWARSATNGYYNGGNKFDLTKWDETYFIRLKDFIQKAKDRDIIVEVMLFSAVYNDELWNHSPMKLSNNINNIGNVSRDNLLNLSDAGVTSVQKTLVKKIVTELNYYENIIFEVCNEPYMTDGGASSAWQNEIISVIVNTENDLPNKHLISQNVNNYYQKITKPNPAIDVFNFHYANESRAYIDNLGLGVVIGNNETGFSQNDVQYRREAYIALLSGSAYFNNLDYAFTVNDETGQTVPPGNPAGGGVTLRKQLGILKNWFETFDYLRMSPATNIVSGLSPGVVAFSLVETGKQYAVFAQGGSQTNVSITLPSGSYSYEWMDTKTGAKTPGTFTHTGGVKTLTSPSYSEDIALKILNL